MGLRKLARSERRSIDGYSLYGNAWDDLPSLTTSSGVRISQGTAFRIVACYAAVRLIADPVASMPAGTFRDEGPARIRATDPAWVDTPDIDGGTWQEFITQWLVSKLLSHAACVRKLRVPSTGALVGFKVLDPTIVRRARDAKTGRVGYWVGTTWVDAEDMIYDAELIRPGQLMGTSKVDEARESLGLSKALEEFAARFFGNGGHTDGIISTPEGTTQEQAEAIKAKWDEKHKGLKNANSTGFLGGGATWQKTSADPDEAQMLESRKFAVEEVARLFRIPPALLQSQMPGATAYASREQDALQFVTFTLLPYIRAIESHLNRVLPAGQYIKINVEGLLRASLADRAAAYSVLTQAGVMTDNEARALEDLPPKAGGDDIRVPLASIAATDAGVVSLGQKSMAALRLIWGGYDPADILRTLDLPAMAHTGQSVQLQPEDVKAITQGEST